MPPLTAQQALQYYGNQLIIQYRTLPKATATIQAVANCNICDGFFFTLQNCFNLATATGEQLTIIGRIVGVPRQIQGLDLVDTFFTFSNWNGLPPSDGFNSWALQPVGPDKIASWQTNVIYTPTDFEMTALILLKIIRNNFYNSLGQIDPILFKFFGTAIQLVDNFNRSITWTFKAPYHNVGSVAAFLGNIVPKPMGVAITYQNI